MAVTLKISSYASGQKTLVGERTLHARRITFGRGAECDVPLDDPKKHISRVHAQLDEQDDGYWLTVISKVNPILANGERHAPGSRIHLQAGARFEMGDFEIEILEVAREDELPPPAPREVPRTAPRAAPPPDDPLMQVLKSASVTPEQVSKDVNYAEAIASAPQHAVHAAPQAPAEVDIPLDLDALPPPEDIFGDELVAETPITEPKPAEKGAEVFAEATFVGKVTPPDDLFDEPTMIGRAAHDEAKQAPADAESKVFEESTYVGAKAAPAAAARAPAAEAKKAFDDETFTGKPPESVFDEPTLPGEVAPAAARPAEEEPRPAARPAQADATAPPAAAKPALDAATLHALRSFLEGAGLEHLKVGEADVDEYLRQSGAIMRASVEGIMALLLARAAARKELQAEDRTMVAARDNNPLKLMSDPKEAIAFLFDTGERTGGFLNPVQAITDACEDLRTHEIALIAGMRAAILGAIRRFDPQAIEKEMEKTGGGGFSMSGRKPKLWDFFVASQEKLARDAEDDFNRVFGREFMAAYMAQVKKLRPPGKQ